MELTLAPSLPAVYLRKTTSRYPIPERRITRIVQQLLEALGEDNATVSITFVGDRSIRRLNREHRGKDRPTDVLSFPLYTPKELKGPPPGSERMLGDVVVSVETAARQARAYGAPLAREVERLMIHGVLHLLGHDHHKRREREKMTGEERRLAAVIGMPWPQAYRSGK